MSFIVIHSAEFAEHQTPPGHPERPERAEVMDVVAAEWRRTGGEVVAPRSVSREQLSRVPRGFLPEHPAADLLRHKQFLAMKEYPAEFCYDPGFYPELLKVFRAISPMVRYFDEALLG